MVDEIEPSSASTRSLLVASACVRASWSPDSQSVAVNVST
jgi:hypothetical protein